MTRLTFGILCTLSLMTAIPVLAQQAPQAPCDKTSKAQRAACYRQQFTAADRRLNEVYKRLAAALDPPRRQDMQADSQTWIAYKEEHCLAIAVTNTGLTETKAKQHTEYVACLYELTSARTTYLQRAFGREGVTAALAGTYDDGVGGTLTLRRKHAETYAFHLSVVRGPTHHVGNFEDTVTLTATTTTFVQKNDCGGDTPCCRLTFTKRPWALKIDAESCEAWHGARAYFDGTYRKVQ